MEDTHHCIASNGVGAPRKSPRQNHSLKTSGGQKIFYMLKAIKPYQGIKRGATGKGKGGTFALTTFNFGTT